MTESSSFRRVRFALRQGEMAGIAFGDESRAPEIVFLHATGFNARTYAQLLAPLGERFHVLALDLRGHGLTHLPTRRLGYDSWNRHRDDVIELADKHLPAAAVFAGHSLGGAVSLLVAGKRPDLARGLALLDPVILPAPMARMMALPFAPLLAQRAFPIARMAARRREHFDSLEAAQAALTGRGIFKSFSPEMLADYVGDGFMEAPDGGVRLRCSPKWEAATFAAQRHNALGAFSRVRGPIVILRAETGSTCSPAAVRKIIARRPDVRIATVEGSTHGLPMERGDRCRAAIETVATRGVGSRTEV
jgi:pimeloyl-ACP methyl ester carboxylesterase